MEGAPHDDVDSLRALASSGARVLLIGRRALVALGLPVVTADYDVWIHFDDVEILNRALAPLDFVPNHSPSSARQRGRYVLEDGDHIDVILARSKSTPSGRTLDFDGAWSRREGIVVEAGVTLHMPCLDDLIMTKEWGSRPRDLIDIEHLEALRSKERRAEMSDLRRPPPFDPDAPLDAEDFARRLRELRAYIAAHEEAGDETRELVRWFMSRYPSLVDRCRYVTRRHRELTRSPAALALATPRRR